MNEETEQEITSVLIVDDLLENLIALEAVLQKSNYRIDKAISGKEAIEKILLFEYDCILLDVHMPGLDGFEVAEILGQNKLTKSIPIIFLTALVNEKQYMLKGYKIGVVEYLNKSIDSDILKIKVDTFSKLHKQKKEIIRSNEEAKKIHGILESHSSEMGASIRYAKNIQNAILPKEETFKYIFPDAFVIYQPKDIVGGDFYWVTIIRGKTIVVCADCTGHGVPGALMTMVGHNLVKQAVEVKQLLSPAAILEYINKALKSTFNHHNLNGRIADGMEVGICIFDFSTNILEYSGARIPLLITKNGLPALIKPDNFSISYDTPINKKFTDHQFELNKGDCIYMFTDGYADQFGGENDKRFMKKNLLNQIRSVIDEELVSQKTILLNVFDGWRGKTTQVDDVLVIGIKL